MSITLKLPSLAALCGALILLSAPFSGMALDVTVHIQDGSTQEPLAAWCELTDPSGKHFFPKTDKIRGDHEPPHFYVWDQFEVELKSDVVYTLKVRKGLGWLPFNEKMEFREGHTNVIVSMNAWYRPKDRAWVAGDLEGRWSYLDPGPPISAWDLSAVCRIVDATAAIQDAEKMVAGFHLLPGDRAYTGRDWGYRDFNVLRTNTDPIVNETGFRRTALEEMFVARDREGLIDVVRPSAREMPVAAAHGLISAIRVLGPDKPGDNAPWEMDRIQERLERYYDFLNCGFRIPVSAGSGATERGPSEWDFLGANRLYCRVPPTVTLGHYLNVYLRGCSWATNGPLISLVAKRGKDLDLGSVANLKGPDAAIALSVGARSPRPIDRLEVIYNGEVAHSFPGSATSDHILQAVNLSLPKGGWIAARVFETRAKENDPVRFAHTSPIYVNVEGTDSFDRETVQAFASQIAEDRSRFESDEALPEREKSLLLEWYGFARDFYLQKLN